MGSVGGEVSPAHATAAAAKRRAPRPPIERYASDWAPKPQHPDEIPGQRGPITGVSISVRPAPPLPPAPVVVAPTPVAPPPAKPKAIRHPKPPLTGLPTPPPAKSVPVKPAAPAPIKPPTPVAVPVASAGTIDLDRDPDADADPSPTPLPEAAPAPASELVVPTFTAGQLEHYELLFRAHELAMQSRFKLVWGWIAVIAALGIACGWALLHAPEAAFVFPVLAAFATWTLDQADERHRGAVRAFATVGAAMESTWKEEFRYISLTAKPLTELREETAAQRRAAEAKRAGTTPARKTYQPPSLRPSSLFPWLTGDKDKAKPNQGEAESAAANSGQPGTLVEFTCYVMIRGFIIVSVFLFLRFLVLRQ
jgi:hypothetical protein